MSDEADDFKIAVVGLACYLPQAPTVTAYWKALVEGTELLSHFSKEDAARVLGIPTEEVPEDLVRSYGFIQDADRFDHQFFGYTRKEALRLDPQHRIFLQTCWHALEDASCDPAKFSGRIGVFGGSGPSDHYYHLKSNLQKLGGASDWELKIDTGPDFLVTRVAYKLGLRGPAVAVHSACSTSLVAIHIATQSLLAGESDMVLAGGVTLSTIPKFDIYDPGGITAKDGHCRPFDEKATGTIGSSGCGVVALKLLKDAVADGDHVYAVITSSSINNDGAAKMSFSAPSIVGQREVIARTLQAAEIDPNEVGFIETHGTGTILGDPIEVASLNQAYGMSKEHACYIGSVKSNIGHTDAAAGACGFIKAVLAVHHGVIPPTVNFDAPNPNLKIEETHFSINKETVDWPKTGSDRRRAAVNSLGLGGTNAHVLLEEYKGGGRSSKERSERKCHFPVSASGPIELAKALRELANFVQLHPDRLEDIATTLQTGRRDFSHRRAFVADFPFDLIKKLKAAAEDTASSSIKAAKTAKTAFVFPGQGGQYEGMGAALMSEGGTYARIATECLDIFEKLGVDLRSAKGEDIHKMSFAQAAVFTLEVSLGFQYKELLGEEIHALLGHSLGAYAAACLAGVFTLEDACRVVKERGQIFENLEDGSMLAVLAPPTEIEPLLTKPLSIAAINNPSQIVVSGPVADVTAFAEILKTKNVEHRKIHVSRAAHSSMLDPHL
ncbi:MAG: type I polyketide synthase, partial [Bdellovibrionota bacterium]